MSFPYSGGGSAPASDRARESRTLARLEALARSIANGGVPSAVVSYPHPLVLHVVRGDALIVVAPPVIWDSARDLLAGQARRFAEGSALVVLLGRPRSFAIDDALALGVAAVVDDAASEVELVLSIRRAIELVDARLAGRRHERSSQMYGTEVQQLLDVARAMTTERNVDKLLAIILEKARTLTTADAGSLYVVEGPEGEQALRFKIAQNESVAFDSREFVMPISRRSIAGTAVLEKRSINIEDVYELPPGSPFGFDKSFDAKIGYRTKSMLTAPLVSQRDEVIGVLQLINKKRVAGVRLDGPEQVEAHVEPFDYRSETLLGMLATQAAASLETAMLYQEIQSLFDGFVKASVEAIESRDPTTSGHSRRVADYTVELARVVSEHEGGAYGPLRFSEGELREIEYASLLHDFGKIGVRERVLVKAKKLYEERLELISSRFDYVRRGLEAAAYREKLAAIAGGASASDLRAYDEALAERLQQVDDAYGTILVANEPTVLQAGEFARIAGIAAQTYVDARGEEKPLLTPEEVEALSVRRGSLTEAEYDEIRSHVTHTYRFLSRIPWGKALRRVPLIAGAHHERLNGTGYPGNLKGDDVPIQSRMMSIADIFDALTASDRPYKKAVPIERALDILDFEVKDGHLDHELVRVFREARIWERVETRRRPTSPPPSARGRHVHGL